MWGQEARRQSQESLETVKKDIDHAHFQERIPQIKDYETHFTWNDDDQRYVAKDDAGSTFILRLLQNPRSSDFKSTKKLEPRALAPTESNLRDHQNKRIFTMGAVDYVVTAAEDIHDDDKQRADITPSSRS